METRREIQLSRKLGVHNPLLWHCEEIQNRGEIQARRKPFREKLNYRRILLNKMFFRNRPPAFPSRLKKIFLRALSGFFADLIIYSEKSERKNLDSETMILGQGIEPVPTEIDPKCLTV